MKKYFAPVLCLALTMAAASSAMAQAPARIRGVIEKVDGSTLTVKTKQGDTATVKLAPNAAVTSIAKVALADIKQGSFIGAGARPQPDGSLKAVQVMVFPEAMRGTGEGHRDWDALPQTTMTNATVAQMVTGVDGSVISLKYKDGEKKLVIASDANIITLVPAEVADLKAGSDVQIVGTKGDDGSYTTSRVTVSKNGVPLPL